MRRVVELPSRGRLLVATDIQGNLCDFERVVTLYEEACQHPEGAVLVVTGDLVHGPEIPEPHWPEYLGSFFRGQSALVLELAEELSKKHPGRVHFLLGNHEHAHIGGPVVSKFFADEALRLEGLLGTRRTRRIRSWFRNWPLVALARSCGLLMLHGAPNASLQFPEELDQVKYDIPGAPVDELLLELLWARSASPERARAFLDCFDPALVVSLYGHDVARSGHHIAHEPLLCVSTSFGCFDGDKMYLDWELDEKPSSASDMATRGLKALYPDAAPVYRAPF